MCCFFCLIINHENFISDLFFNMTDESREQILSDFQVKFQKNKIPITYLINLF